MLEELVLELELPIMEEEDGEREEDNERGVVVIDGNIDIITIIYELV